MVLGQNRAGEGVLFEEYFEDQPDTIIESEYQGIKYRIHLQQRAKDGNYVDSHYTGYVCLADITDDWEELYIQNLPHSPGSRGVNFGPTEDGWIGFGTLDGRDYNYTNDLVPLEGDERISKDELLTAKQRTQKFTPEIIHNRITTWIEEILEYVESD